MDRALGAWPGIGRDLDRFFDHAQQLGADEQRLEQYGADLYLAFTCAVAALPSAIRVLERDYLPRVDPAVRRLSFDPSFVDEVRQQLRERLLVPPQPRLATYSGTGPLSTWLRVAAVRLGLNLLRREKGRATNLVVDQIAEDACADQAELARYRAALTEALHLALTRLEPQARTLLKLHYAEGVTLEQLAASHQVHRATIARRLLELRRSIFSMVEKDVRNRLKLTGSEFRSVLRSARSRMEASLSSLFGETPE
jgi:RNA polymerase sigma-70 factor (ECF subfamily)